MCSTAKSLGHQFGTATAEASNDIRPDSNVLKTSDDITTEKSRLGLASARITFIFPSCCRLCYQRAYVRSSTSQAGEEGGDDILPRKRKA